METRKAPFVARLTFVMKCAVFESSGNISRGDPPIASLAHLYSSKTTLGAEMPVTAFTAIKLRRWLTRRWGKAAPATWNARLTASRVLIGYCQRQGWLERDPATCLERRRTPRDETRAVPFEALEALAGLTAEFLAPCPGGGKAGFHTLAEPGHVRTERSRPASWPSSAREAY